MKTDLFDFDLPDERIALRPARPRDSAKLLQVKNGGLADYIIRDLPSLLKPGDVLVLNETKVIPAFLQGMRAARPYGGGGDVKIDFNLHKQTARDCWRAFARPAKRLKIGDEIDFCDGLLGVIIDKNAGGDVEIRFNASDAKLNKAVENKGNMPLPPYIGKKRSVDNLDIKDYQTVYAKYKGSVAAPTAGLHFTHEILEELQAKGVKIEKLVLHVGAGTFLPVTGDDTKNHKMHSEWYEIGEKTAKTINNAKKSGGRIIAVGTTSLRALESAGDDNGILRAQAEETDIFITPGYEFRIIDGLLTNFHLPKSTLFMLVCALCGLEVMQKAYRHAIKSDYRFYSYGDASLLWRENGQF